MSSHPISFSHRTFFGLSCFYRRAGGTRRASTRPRAVSRLLVVTLLAASQVCAAESPDRLAARVLEAVGRPVGLAHLPRCGDGALAMALAAADTNLLVHGQDADDARVRQARRLADEQGLLGRRAWFDQGDLTRLLPAGHSADLVALVDLGAGDLTPGLAAEIRRVLHPWFGVAVLGDASGKLGAAALRSWAGAIAGKVATLPGEGVFVTVQADALPGADDWPMWWHGADNNAVSADTSFNLPATIQWTGKPFFAPTRLELPIISAGRLFMLWNGNAMDMSMGALTLAGPAGDGPLLTAQAVGSGARLWARRLSPAAWLQVARSVVIGDGDRLFVADGGALLELNAATGRDIRSKTLDCPEIKWMTLCGGRLFVLGGSVTENYGQRSEKAVAPFRSSGLNLIALDSKTLEPIWRVDREAGKNAFDPRSPAIDGDRLFVAGEGDTAEAFSVKDGKSLWQVKAGFDRARIVSYDWDRSSRHPVTGYAAMGVYVIAGLEMKEAVVLSQTDGKRLWTRGQPGAGAFMPVAFWDLLWSGRSSADPSTGKALGKMLVGKYRVGREGDGRDFPIDAKVDFAADEGVQETLYKSLRLVSSPTTYTVEGLPSGSACVVRLHLFEPWNDVEGRRLMDVTLNGAQALKGFDAFKAAGGKNKACICDVPAQTDGNGKLAILIAGTPGCADPGPVLCGIEIRQEAESLVTMPAAGTFGPVKGFQLLKESCSRETMAPFLQDAAYAPAEPLKSSCGAGNFVADGLLWKFPSPCTGCTEWRGFIAQAAQESPQKPPARLHREAAATAAPAAAEANPQGWLTYRGDATRSDATAIAIPAAAAIRWSAVPAHPTAMLSHGGQTLGEAEMVPTPPVVAGERVIVAGADGAVDALDLASGKRLWRAYTSGRIESSPTIWRDRVFVGSTDGQLYALSLADGRELWRLRAAPDASRIMVYEQLGSRWPILGSPLAADGKVVVSAGLIDSIDGVHAVCADATNGGVLWERSDWGASEAGGRISGGAQFALSDELFYHGGMAPPVRLSMKDGACHPAFPDTPETRTDAQDARTWRAVEAFYHAWGRTKGQDIGVFSKHWIVYGGRRLWTDQAESGTWRSTIKFLGRDGNGEGRMPVIDVEDAELLPCWDAEAAAFICTKAAGKPMGSGGIVLVPRDKLQQALDALMVDTDAVAAPDGKTPAKKAASGPALFVSKTFKASAEALCRWRSGFDYGWQPLACVLTPNAVLVVTARPSNKPSQDNPGKLTALNRADGKKLWEVVLPARAVNNGLAVAADGSLILTLVDGETLCIGAETVRPQSAASTTEAPPRTSPL